MQVTVTAVFHREGPLAIPALASMHGLVRDARAAGVTVEARALLDVPDARTRDVVARRGEWLDDVREVAFGDLGLTRNAGTQMARGDYLAFLDGDDLWGASWLTLALERARADAGAIWHPEMLYYFTEADFDAHSSGPRPHPQAQSFFMRHAESVDPSFDPDVLSLNNAWTANVFAHRSLHERFPYEAIDRAKGLGFEDWTWNARTLREGVAHRVVPNTIHMIRMKATGSLGRQSDAEGLLPRLPPQARPAPRGDGRR